MWQSVHPYLNCLCNVATLEILGQGFFQVFPQTVWCCRSEEWKQNKFYIWDRFNKHFNCHSFHQINNNLLNGYFFARIFPIVVFSPFVVVDPFKYSGDLVLSSSMVLRKSVGTSVDRLAMLSKNFCARLVSSFCCCCVVGCCCCCEGVDVAGFSRLGFRT